MPKTANLGLRLEQEVKDALIRAAAEDHRSVASYIEVILIRHLRGAGYLPTASGARGTG